MEFFQFMSLPQVIASYLPAGNIEDLIANIHLVYRVMFAVISIVYAVCLALGGIGLYTMAKRAGLSHAWLSFLPFGNTYISGKLAGEVRIFGKPVKHIALYSTLIEAVYVIMAAFILAISLQMYNASFFKEVIEGNSAWYEFDIALVPVAARGWFTALDVLTYISWVWEFVVLFFFCMMYMAFFRKYYARGPFLMTFLCVFLPARAFVFFAVRNNAPVDYEQYMRQRMQEMARRQQSYGPYGDGQQPHGGYGQNPYGNPYGGPQGPGSAPSHPAPFSDLDGTSSGPGGEQGGAAPRDDDAPFSDL